MLLGMLAPGRAIMDTHLDRTLKRKLSLVDPDMPNKRGRSPSNESVSSSYSTVEGEDLTPRSSTTAPSRTSSVPPCRIKSLACTYAGCDKVFNRPARLEEHIRSHTNSRIFACPHAPCTKDFLRQSHLKRHIDSAHAEIRNYLCEHDGCGKSFATGTRLRRHAATHERQDRHRCLVSGCGQSFRKHATLQRHQLVVHEGQPAFTCDAIDSRGRLCGRGYDNAYKLKLHQGRDHGAERFACTLCQVPADDGTWRDLPFSTYSDFQHHNRSVHPPTCQFCSQICRSARDLTAHTKQAHGAGDAASNASFRCEVDDCGRSFTQKSNLTTHIKTVHGDSRFTCAANLGLESNHIESWDGQDACGKAFKTKSSLERHIRSVHLPHTRNAGQIISLTSNDAASSILDCSILGCAFATSSPLELSTHLQQRHGLTADDTRLKAFAADENMRDLEGLACDAAFEPMDEDWSLSLEQAAVEDGMFWLATDSVSSRPDSDGLPMDFEALIQQ